jgi:hypothetical protein
MRQLFVPACVCLMTFSSSAGGDPKLSLEQFTGARIAKAERAVGTDEPEAGTNDSGPAAGDESAATASDVVPKSEAAVAPRAVADIPIEIPVQNADALPSVADAAMPLPKPKPEIKPVVWRSREEICDSLTRAAEANNLPAPFFIRLLFQESGFHPGVVSPVGAQGIAQFMPATAADMGLDNPFDPLQAIPASARLLRNLFQRFGNLGLAAAAYNAGPKRIQDWLTKKGVLPQETQGYVKIITGRPAETWKVAANGTPAMKLPKRAPCQEAVGLLAWNGPEAIPVPATAPHRRIAEPVAVAQAQPAKGAKLAHRAAHAKVMVAPAKTAAKPDVKVADKTDGKRDDKRKSAVIDVAAKPAAKGTVQLTASRKQDSKNKKVRVSSAK